ncbi:MAG: alpha/beta hydrolase [Pirellulaceae bacterium]
MMSIVVMRRWPRFLRIAVFLVASYLGCVIMLAFLQRSFIYHPRRESPIDPSAAELPLGRVHSVCIEAEDGVHLNGWHIIPRHERATTTEACDRVLSSGRWLVLYFSGNAANRQVRAPEFSVLTDEGANVFLFDYRGYGDNRGSPSETHLAADAWAVWRYATRDRNVPTDRVVFYGESLGGGVAVRLAAELSEAGTPPAGLILRSTFSSLVDAAAYHFPWAPVRWMLVDRYPSIDRIPQVTCPILQIHGRRDRIVPFTMASRLFGAAPDVAANGLRKRFVELPDAGHNDILYVAEPELRRAVREFFQDLEKVSGTFLGRENGS